jgi:WXG100 family type VII secretion target
MMADQIKMNFGMMEDMARVFAEGAQTLESVGTEVGNIAKALQDGALLGDAGEAFADACSGPLASSVDRIREKLLELKGDIEGAAQDMQDADSTTVGYY